MKPRLPKLLLSAVIVLSSVTQGVTLSNSIFDNNGNYSGNKLEVSGTVVLNDDHGWFPTDNATMSGNGTITSAATYDDFIFCLEFSGNGTIESGVKFKNFDLYVYNSNLTVNATFVSNCSINLYGGTTDISGAKFNELIWLVSEGATIEHPNFEINRSVFYNIQDSSSKLIGNLICNGGNMILHGNIEDATTNTFGGIIFSWYEDYSECPSLTITGSLIIKAETPVIFLHEGYTYEHPSEDAPVFICHQLESQSKLGSLKPFFASEETGKIDFQDSYQFEARTGEGGLTYIYLVEGSSSTPNFSGGGSNTGGSSSGGSNTPPPGLNVLAGQTIEITQRPDSLVNMLGGTADATQAPADILNADIFKGDRGTVITTLEQVFSMDGSQDIGYSIVGPDGQPGAILSIGEAGGSPASIRLNGERYDTLDTTIGNGTLTISEGTTLGCGGDSLVELKGKGSNATNFGRVAADIDMGSGSSFLNQGTIDGLMNMSSGAIFTNNATINGDVIISEGAQVYGSGTFKGTTIVDSNGLLYVGNSPGYQQHTDLLLMNQSRLGFYIDGTTPASRGNTGSGTHSFVTVSGALTLEGVVNVEIGIGMGIVMSGEDSFSLTLMKAMNPEEVDATGASFNITLTEGEELLEEGSAQVTWQEELCELVFSATVSETAKASLTAGDYANTLWASASALKNFADTAANQFLIGKPGETIAWGAGIGSFMNHTGSSGFDYNGGGYAIGFQHAVSEEFRAGVAIGQTYGTFTADNGRLKSDQTGNMVAITAQYVEALQKGVSSWGLSGYMAYGGIENSGKGMFGSNTWEDTMYTVGLHSDYRTQIGENSSLTLFTGIEYTYGSQEEIRLMPGLTLTDGHMQTLSIPVGVTLRTKIDMAGYGILAPELTVAYKGYINQQAPSVRCNSYKINGSNPGRHELMINAGANWLLNESWSIGAFYSLETRSDAVNHAGNLSVRYVF